MTASFLDESIQRLSEEPPLPSGPFDVIYADPPWRYDFSRSESRSIPSHYDNLPIEDVCAIPVSSASADDSVLFLWATSPKLPEALAVLRAWGFTYVTHAIWDKRTFGLGYWFRGAHELLLVGVHGNPPAPPASRLRESVLTVQRGAHSAKPEDFRRLIVRYTPWASRYLELFGRGRPRKGWTYWGDQAVEHPGSGGRPRVHHFDREEAVRLRAEGLSWGRIAERVGASRSAVERAVARAVSNFPRDGFETPVPSGSRHPEPSAGHEEIQ